MTKLGFVTFAFLFSLASSALAQTAPNPKVGYINSDAFFDEKVGITKLVAANKQLNKEFEQRIKELQDTEIRIQNILKELENMQKLPREQFNQAAFTAKKEEGERLDRELNYKKTELENDIAKRRKVVVTPVNEDIGKGIDEFAKKNGYGVIFDIAKMIDAGVVLFFAEAADATKDFIAFYNARSAAQPATPTTRTTP